MRKDSTARLQAIVNQYWPDAWVLIKNLGGHQARLYLKIDWLDEEFPKARDHAMVIHHRKDKHTLLCSQKMLKCSDTNLHAIIRHELGHVIDEAVPTKRLDDWALDQGVELAWSDEQRADDIAEALWDDKIYYDWMDLQTLGKGVYPRPSYLHK